MAIDINSLDMPAAPGEESNELDLGMEKGMEEESPLAEFSDEELLEEVTKRGLIEPEDAEMDEEIPSEGEAPAGLEDLGL
jgi:hypothetical protein